jgi:Double-GTPase 2
MPTEDHVEPAPEAERAGETLINLPSGKPLRSTEATNLLRAQPTPVVLLAGAAKSGKTTLLASLHDCFQWGPFAGYLAAGSETLLGFEEQCFDSRVASGAEKPSTGRTSLEAGQQFYHLRVRHESLQHVMSEQSRKFRFRQSRKFRFRHGRQSAGCHSLIPECVSPHRDRVPSGPRRGCAPKGSLDGWARCKTMPVEGMAANGDKVTRSETLLKAELSTLPR